MNDINGLITKYHITITEAATGRLINLTSFANSITASGLHPNYAYQCRVRAVTIENGPYSNAVNITTSEDGKLVKD